ncbi:uncharacterized protein L969DRAFT_96075 [Mixia osmundae IAM 14324]|uniref:Nuclear control of ATPase protein 2 n=1 Tax=Mixia osmundae (strain CBS 9802 / IAM 14324 / JCM 22182 / KY 12970) TaxID=764103 RepID=G7DS40_MIXOS|nr:uncharacterized protein L969DRAFT_96075 [Mixia osmundae IAM 14324]KEI37545.1 hypothetical protein L969DRAFT_96075 [Mixia osmundae IAM 14324]GAA93400.1 hypothetical protein E5Q_00041 [Mixia osmundae IAM 14324]
MSSSFARERAEALADQLDAISDRLIDRESTDDAAEVLTAETGKLRAAIDLVRVKAKDNPRSLGTLQWLHAHTVQILLGSKSTNEMDAASAMKWLLVGHLALATYASALDATITQAVQVIEEQRYWERIATDDTRLLTYLVQTTPTRLMRLGRTLSDRLQILTDTQDRPKSLLRWETYKEALPPTLLVTSFFPHLVGQSGTDQAKMSTAFDPSTVSSRKLLLLTFSPMQLARQEARRKTKSLKALRSRLEVRIGSLAAISRDLFAPEKDVSPAKDISSLLCHLSHICSDVGSTADDLDACTATLARLLGQSLPGTFQQDSITLEGLSRPSRLTRAWPVIIFAPLVTYYGVKYLYDSRATLTAWYDGAIETVRGFFIDWVIEPVGKIIQTVRHGDSELAIMGTQSLKSDLDSLERMVADFGRDEYKMSEAQIAEIASKVREGDLTTVLQAWEKDIKNPLRSAVTGSLVRTLLIQVQKVKVDVALAMNGIEKMLKSQQLTFAFVGVAPSIIILFALLRGLSSLRVGPNAARDVKASRRRAWSSIRSIEMVLNHREAERDVNEKITDRKLGKILIETQVLRTYAGSLGFPTRDHTLQVAFLHDIRDLEQSTDDALKQKVVERIWRSWAKPLSWSPL